jgi:YHS domain-containing protein
MRKFALAVGLSAALLSGFATIPAFAFDENSTAAINVDESGLGLRGYDPVGYFEAGAPTKGSADLTAEHNGVTYHFASSENRDLFTANPSKYAPQYGGFCQMGAALGKNWTVTLLFGASMATSFSSMLIRPQKRVLFKIFRATPRRQTQIGRSSRTRPRKTFDRFGQVAVERMRFIRFAVFNHNDYRSH